jgi:hypothetical membrane protein
MKWPLSSVAGATVIVLYCAFTFSSWALFPTAYNPITNWLSDLGNSSYNPRGAILYNLGCIFTGIAYSPSSSDSTNGTPKKHGEKSP